MADTKTVIWQTRATIVGKDGRRPDVGDPVELGAERAEAMVRNNRASWPDDAEEAPEVRAADFGPDVEIPDDYDAMRGLAVRVADLRGDEIEDYHDGPLRAYLEGVQEDIGAGD